MSGTAEPTILNQAQTRTRLLLSACPGHWAGSTGAPKRAIGVIATMGASILITLLDDAELRRLGIAAGSLAEHCADAGIDWLQMPIPDMGVPDAAFERQWQAHAVRLHAMLDAGGTLALHCRAGLGRTGMIAARVLIERGLPVDGAIALVRARRPGAIETAGQEQYLHGLAAAR